MAAVTKVQSLAGANNFGGATVASSFVTPAGTGIIAGLIQWGTNAGTATLSSCTDDQGNTYVLGTVSTVAGVNYANIYVQPVYIINPIAGVTTVTATFSASVAFNLLNLWELTAGLVDLQSQGTNTGTAVSAGTVTTGTNGSYAMAAATLDDSTGAGNVFTAGTSSAWTLLQNDGGGNIELGAEEFAQATAGSLTGDLTSNRSGKWVAAMIDFKPSVVADILMGQIVM